MRTLDYTLHIEFSKTDKEEIIEQRLIVDDSGTIRSQVKITRPHDLKDSMQDYANNDKITTAEHMASFLNLLVKEGKI